MIRWGQAEYSESGARAAASAYRPDLYRAALGAANGPSEADIRPEGVAPDDRFMDGHVFDPGRIPEYVAAFPVRALAASNGTDEDA